ncbi:MAG: hypothetical protein J0I41_11185 [Filimonas sp.]|nr:hypothetical protein [Filimonas sp.]
MPRLEALRMLYAAGKAEKCLQEMQGEKQYNIQKNEWQVLKARCELKLYLDAAGSDTQADYALQLGDTLEYISNHFRTNEETLLFYIDTQIFFLKTDIQKALAFCNMLTSSDNAQFRLKGLYYRYEIYRDMGDVENMLADLNMLILFTNRLHPQDDDVLRAEQANNYIRKGDVYRLYKRDADNALRAYAESYKYNNYDVLVQCIIANYAIDNAHFELAGKAIKNVFCNKECGKSADALALFQRTWQLIESGIMTKDMISGMLTACEIKDLSVERSNAKKVLLLLKKNYSGHTAMQTVPHRA